MLTAFLSMYKCFFMLSCFFFLTSRLFAKMQPNAATVEVAVHGHQGASALHRGQAQSISSILPSEQSGSSSPSSSVNSEL